MLPGQNKDKQKTKGAMCDSCLTMLFPGGWNSARLQGSEFELLKPRHALQLKKNKKAKMYQYLTFIWVNVCCISKLHRQ